jgi:hypothetical protein
MPAARQLRTHRALSRILRGHPLLADRELLHDSGAMGVREEGSQKRDQHDRQDGVQRANELILGRLLRRVGAIVGWAALSLLALFGLRPACRFALIGASRAAFVSGLRSFLAVLISPLRCARCRCDLALVGLAGVPN